MGWSKGTWSHWTSHQQSHFQRALEQVLHLCSTVWNWLWFLPWSKPSSLLYVCVYGFYTKMYFCFWFWSSGQATTTRHITALLHYIWHCSQRLLFHGHNNWSLMLFIAWNHLNVAWTMRYHCFHLRCPKFLLSGEKIKYTQDLNKLSDHGCSSK